MARCACRSHPSTVISRGKRNLDELGIHRGGPRNPGGPGLAVEVEFSPLLPRWSSRLVFPSCHEFQGAPSQGRSPLVRRGGRTPGVPYFSFLIWNPLTYRWLCFGSLLINRCCMEEGIT